MKDFVTEHSMNCVVAVTGSGKDQRVVVDFGGVGRKTVFAKYLDHDANAEQLN